MIEIGLDRKSCPTSVLFPSTFAIVKLPLLFPRQIERPSTVKLIKGWCVGLLMVWDRRRCFFFLFFQRKIVTCTHNRMDVIRWRITFFDVVLEESWNGGREYRYSTVVSHEISSMAEPFDDKRTLARRGWKSKCVHPVVRHRGTNSTN